MTALDVTLVRADDADLPAFRKELQRAFTEAAAAYGIGGQEVPIPPDEDVRASFRAPGAAVYYLLLEGAVVGGEALQIDARMHRNSLNFFYVAPEPTSQPVGVATPADRRVGYRELPDGPGRPLHHKV